MKGKSFFPFFLILIFIVILVLGCTGRGGGLQTTKEAQFTKGIFNTSIRIDGKEMTETTLTSRQPAEIGIVLRNTGPNDITNLNIKAIGCVDIERSPETIEKFSKGDTDYISWSVRAPELGLSESFGCPLIFRACFEEKSEGYLEIIVLNETFVQEPGEANYYYQSGIFTTEPNFGVFRIINDGKPDTFPGKLRITSSGQGFVDYIGQEEAEKLELGKIRSITMSLDKDSELEFYKIGEITPGYSNVFSSDKKTLTITSGSLDGYEYLLKMIGQKELDVNMWFLAKENPSKAENYERMEYTIDSGYCVDLAILNIRLSGR